MIIQNTDPKNHTLRLSHTIYYDHEINDQKAENLTVYHYRLPKDQYKWREWQSQLDKQLGNASTAYLMRSYRGDFGLFVAMTDNCNPPIIQDAKGDNLSYDLVRFTQEVYPIWIRLIFRLAIINDLDSAAKSYFSLGRPLFVIDHWVDKKNTKAGIQALALDCRTQQIKTENQTLTEIAIFYENIALRSIDNPKLAQEDGRYWIYRGIKTLSRCPLKSWNPAAGPLFKEISKKTNRRVTRPFLDLKNSTSCAKSWPALLFPIQEKFIEMAAHYGFSLTPKVLNLQPLKTKTTYKTDPNNHSPISSIPKLDRVYLLDHRYNQSIPFKTVKNWLSELLREKKISTTLQIIQSTDLSAINAHTNNQPILIILDQRPNVENDRYNEASAFKHLTPTQHLNINPHDLGLLDDPDNTDFFIETVCGDNAFLQPDPLYYQYSLRLTTSNTKHKTILNNLKRNIDICLKELSIKQLLLDKSIKISDTLPKEAHLLTENLAIMTEGYLFTVNNDRPMMIPLQAEMESPYHTYLNAILERFNMTYNELIPLLFKKWPYSYRPEIVIHGFGSFAERLIKFLRRITIVFYRNTNNRIEIFLQDPQYDRPHILFDNIAEITSLLAAQEAKKDPAYWLIKHSDKAKIESLLLKKLLDETLPQSLYENFLLILPLIITTWNDIIKDRFEQGGKPIHFEKLKSDSMKQVCAIINTQRVVDNLPPLKRLEARIYGLWNDIGSMLFNINFQSIRSRWLSNIPGISKIWHDPEQGYYLVGSLAPLNTTLERQPSIRQWHSLGERKQLNMTLLSALVDVDWVRMNQLAGNPCPALLIRRWKELQPNGKEFHASLI